jgi:hypothetical protein
MDALQVSTPFFMTSGASCELFVGEVGETRAVGVVLADEPVGVFVVPRCHGLLGSQNYAAMSASKRSWAYSAISLPRSHLGERRRCSGSCGSTQ